MPTSEHPVVWLNAAGTRRIAWFAAELFVEHLLPPMDLHAATEPAWRRFGFALDPVILDVIKQLDAARARVVELEADANGQTTIEINEPAFATLYHGGALTIDMPNASNRLVLKRAATAARGGGEVGS